jgi:cellulose biosynthesis protein BcsQ
MAKVVALAGSKGGTGKSSLSHLIAHGAGSLPRAIPAVVLTTDIDDEVLADDRRYLVLDGRDPKRLAEELERLLAEERLLVVIDGAAGRPEIDAIISDVADLVLLPFGPSAQDAVRAAKNLEALPQAVALPNRWPTHPGVAKRAKRWLEMVPAARRLPPFKAIPRLDGLLAPHGYQELAYEIAAPARGLVLEILFRAKTDPNDLTA